ncbi:hypothetical protein SB521682_3578 [Shigella boydii 5216-82]|nr:hypothetical protein SB521682_3578 [Shigella boydii 5216-82]EIQ26134.1 hypothetical protein SB96558_3963 [Shigella boydii 965-58]
MVQASQRCVNISLPLSKNMAPQKEFISENKPEMSVVQW